MSILFSSISPKLIIEFNKNTDLKKWSVVDDVVMGGQSSGSFKLNSDGHGAFSGDVSLKNYGGFSSVRYECGEISVKGYTKVRIKIRGDGKSYQFRIRLNSKDSYSFITTFSTSGEWEEVEIALKDMYPSFRGRKINQPNFSSDSFEEITFLIANKKEEKFELMIDKIELI